MSWTQRVKHPSELFQKGDEVEAVLLNIDTDDGDKPKISLGIKQLVTDPWDRIPADYPLGKIVKAKVLKVLDFGAFVELEKGVEGLVHISEIAEEHIDDPRAVLEPDQDVNVKLISIDPAERKIGLSIRAAIRDQEMADAQGYALGSTGGATLGDVMSAKLGAVLGAAEATDSSDSATETDSAEAVSTEADSAEANSAEANSAEADSADADSADADSAEADSADADSTDADSTDDK